jgi:hypothetical protein
MVMMFDYHNFLVMSVHAVTLVRRAASAHGPTFAQV